MQTPERSAERDEAILAMVPLVPEHGWSLATLRRALPAPEDAELLFGNGVADIIETYADLADRRMEQAASGTDMTELGLTRRVRTVIALRLAALRADREAIRRALSVLTVYPGAAARITARTVDSIWHAAGDRSADFSWYTKRAILAGIYGSTLLFWLNDGSEDDAATLEFLDRRLAGIGRLGKAKARVNTSLARLRPA
jgi:ubiquinone biosynthesis protein COQ9